MTNQDRKVLLLQGLDELKNECPLQDAAGSAWLDGVAAARSRVAALVPDAPELEAEVSDAELVEFPRMQAVRACILAGGGRATRSAILEGAAIVGAFVEYELRQADEQREREAEAALEARQSVPADIGAAEVVWPFAPVKLEQGKSVTLTMYAPEWIGAPEFVSELRVAFSDVVIGAESMPDGLPEKIQKGMRIACTVTNVGPAGELRAYLVGELVHPDNQNHEPAPLL